MRVLGFFAAALVVTSVASADTNTALAEALFREATDAFKEGRVAEACAKFAESQRLDPQRGTLANLARCHEREGKTASAWSDYTALLELSRKANDEPRIKYAEQRLKELEPALPKVKLATEPGLQVKEARVDGTSVGSAAIGTTFPIDPGTHKIDVTSSDGRTWSQSFDTPANETTTVTLKAPPPEKVGPTPNPNPNPHPLPETATSERTWQKPLGIAVAATGGAALLVGGVLGVLVVVKKSDVDANCSGKVCNPIGFAAQNDAWGLSTGATVALIAGGVLVAAGAVLFFTAPKPAQTVGLHITPLGVEGTW